MDIMIAAGTKVKGADGERYVVTVQTETEGDLAILAPKSKTYMLKATCPICHRVIRVTSKNWAETDARANITCMHKDGNAYNFVLYNEEATE